MTPRSQRRAAARKAAKLAKKNSAQQSAQQLLTKTATAHGAIDDDQPPSRLDPAPERPVPDHLLDPFEEGDVELSEFYLRKRQRQVDEFTVRLAARKAAEAEAAQNAAAETEPGTTSKKPVSEAQLNANRANAQHSTGATSEEGKAHSSRNNFRHGLTQTEGDLILLPDESKEDYARALAGFLKEWQPATETEHDLVQRLASRQWLRRRAMRLQTQYLAFNGQILDYEQHALYRRYEATHDRGFNKALADLIRLRSLRLREQNGFESQQRKNAEHGYRIRALQHREKLHELAIRIAEAKLKRLESAPAAKKQANEKQMDPDKGNHAPEPTPEPPLAGPPLPFTLPNYPKLHRAVPSSN